MSNRKVSIIERVKRNGKWVWGEKWELPVKFTLKDGSRPGKFYVLWYRGANKVLTPVPKRKGEKLPDLNASLLLARIKQRHLEDEADGLKRPDPVKPENRITIDEGVQKFLSGVELTKDPETFDLYEQNLREYSEWTKLIYIDDIDKDHLFAYRKHLMDGGNGRLTADWKLLRINKMVKAILKLDQGKRKYDAKAPKRVFHPDYELADEIEHYEWQMTGEEKTTPDGLRLFEFAVCPICDEVHRDMAKGSFKCCLTIGDYGLGFIWQGTRHSDATIKDVWEACEDRGCEPFPYYRYADEDPADFLNQGTADRHAVKLPKVYPLTDMGNAERFEQHFASEFIWTKETGWLAYRDGVWEEDKTAEADQAMQVTVRLITQEAELVEGDDEAAENMRDAIIGWAKQSEANAKIKAALERASKLKAFARSYADFDRQSNLFNCANGTIDLNTMEFRAHDPSDLLTKISPISYSPDAQCPQWEKFVLEVMDGKEHMMRYLQRWMGYTMTANTGEQCMAVPYGRGGTGKSTFLHVMAGVLGDYAKTADAEMLMAKRGDAGQPFEMAGMEGTRLLFAIETEEGKTLATAKVKRMTGQDPMKACYKFQNHFEFVPVWKIWLATNDQPNVRALDDAYWDRVKVVPFTVKFRDTEKQVRDLDEKLLTEEGSGILNWCVAGCREWKRIGLQHPEEVNIAVKEWREREDYLARFLEERTEATDKPDEFVQRSKLFESFSRWAEETKEGRGLKEKTFVEDMKRKGYTPDSIKQGGKTMRVWMNLKLTSLLGEYGPQVRPEDVM